MGHRIKLTNIVCTYLATLAVINSSKKKLINGSSAFRPA